VLHRDGQASIAGLDDLASLLAAELSDQLLARLNEAGIWATKRGPEGPLSWVANGVIRPDLPSRE
jgi:hypothetical protein